MATLMSPERKAKREAYLEEMRRRFRRRKYSTRNNKANKKPRKKRKKRQKLPNPRKGVALLIANMNIGESSWFATTSKKAHAAAHHHGAKVKTRTSFKDGVVGIRIWRLE